MDDNELFELELTGMAHGGSAIGRHDGRAIFVPYGIVGERVLVRITLDKTRFAIAEIVEVLHASESRIEPRCQHYGICGGCHLQHVEYAAQLTIKQQVVREQLERIGGLVEVEVPATIASPDPWAYRTHATFHADEAGQLGFIATDENRLVPIELCHIIRPELAQLYDDLNLESFETLDRVRLQVGSDPADLALGLSTTDDEIPEIELDLPVSVTFLTQEDAPQLLIGEEHVTYQIKDRTFKVRIGGFFQVNLAQAETLVDLVLAHLDLQGHERVLDLYSGVGLFTAFIAQRSSHVTAIESYTPAVDDADLNLAEFENIDLIDGLVEDVLPELTGPFDAVVLDPPRSGMEGIALDALVALGAAKIVYVSCDLATFARDAKRLAIKGYTLRHVQPVDMFPQTASIELVAWFSPTA